MGVVFITKPGKKNAQGRWDILIPEDFHEELKDYLKNARRIRVTVDKLI